MNEDNIPGAILVADKQKEKLKNEKKQ